MKHHLTTLDVEAAAAVVVERSLRNYMAYGRPLRIYGVPRGGIPAAFAVAHQMQRKHLDSTVVQNLGTADVIVDDIYDSGKTKLAHESRRPGILFEVLFDKRDPAYAGKWLVLPWEHALGVDSSADDIVTRLLQYIGEDPTREGLQETPRRFLAAWKEWASGYYVDPASVMRMFQDGAEGVDELVVVHNIPIVSKCEHHLADMIGIAHVGYIPNGRIVGLSKLPRLVEVYARRLQVQERLTNQIANALEEHLAPAGIAVVLRCSHACMSTRGAKVHGSTTTTSAMRGLLRTNGDARHEFLALCRAAEARG